MSMYPRMLYRYPATSDQTSLLQDGEYDTLIVDSDTEEEAAVLDGYEAHPDVARAVGLASTPLPPITPAPPPMDRARLETTARSLGVRFDGRTSDKKLGDLIAAVS